MLDTAHATPPSTHLTRSLLTALHAEQLRSPRLTCVPCLASCVVCQSRLVVNRVVP
jgi:hypothetical protein